MASQKEFSGSPYRFFILTSALLFSIALAACGGGSGAGTSRPTSEVSKEISSEETVEVEDSSDEVSSPFAKVDFRTTSGDCYDVSDETVKLVSSCEELHLGEVFLSGARLYIPAGEDDAEVWYDILLDACGSEFEAFTGDDPEDSSSRWLLWGLLEQQEDDETIVSCTVESADGELWAGTAENVVGSYSGIEVGDCFDFPTETLDARKVDCSVPHEGEMFIVDAPIFADNESAPYPTDEEWSDLATLICDKPFEDYTGYSPYDESVNISYSLIYTLEGDWYDVERRALTCAVVSYDGTLLEGSWRR